MSGKLQTGTEKSPSGLWLDFYTHLQLTMKVSSVPSKSNGGNFHAKQRQEVLYPGRRDPYRGQRGGLQGILPAQKNGECRCTKAQLWKCDGVCPGCPFYAAGKKVSIDTPIGGEEDEFTLGDTLADEAPSAESILMDKELLDALYDELNRLDPDGRRICELIMQGKTEREIAADMGKRQSTINYQKNKVFSILREALKDFI